MAHPVFASLASMLVAIGLAMVDDRTPRERIYTGARVLLGCAAAIVGGGWLMYWIHG